MDDILHKQYYTHDQHLKLYFVSRFVRGVNSCTMAVVHGKCYAYDDFQEHLNKILSKHSCLNQEEELCLLMKETKTELICEGVVNMMEAWVTFLHHLLEEALTPLLLSAQN